jgi:acetyl-CoA acetyltransferase
MNDAGLGSQDVDGILEFNIGNSVPTEAVATALGLPELNYAIDWRAGGFSPSALVAIAAMAADCGMAKSALVYRAMNGRSGFRLGGSGKITVIPASGGAQYRMPYGWLTFGENMAMWCRRHMEKYGTKPEHLAAIAISQRENAMLNERACQRKPLTLDAYMSSRMITEPHRLYDMCLEFDGGCCALLLTSPDRAKNCRKKPVLIKASGYFAKTAIGDTGYADNFLRELY